MHRFVGEALASQGIVAVIADYHVTLVASMASVLRGHAPVLERVTAFVKSAR